MEDPIGSEKTLRINDSKLFDDNLLIPKNGRLNDVEKHW